MGVQDKGEEGGSRPLLENVLKEAAFLYGCPPLGTQTWCSFLGLGNFDWDNLVYCATITILPQNQYLIKKEREQFPGIAHNLN